MRSDAIRPGDVVAGKYRVRAVLSRTRGFLCEGFHTEFDQRVVLRILSPNLVDDKQAERFRREARILAKLESEHVARILDVGTLPDGAFYFVRQYVDGTDLGVHLKKNGALKLPDAALLILQACEAVAETHAHNILLRELQPSHLFLTHRLGGAPLVKIVDFGTAKLMRDAAPPSPSGELTSTSMFGLSPYSSPELMRKAKNIDVRTDVWSLGTIFYQLLTGRAPFTGEMAALMLSITKDDPVPVSTLRRDLSPEVDAVITWSLAKDVEGRYKDVYAFAHAIAPFAPPEGQVLVARIRELVAAAKKKRAAGPQGRAAAADDAISMDNDELIELDDEEDEDEGQSTRVLNKEILSAAAASAGHEIEAPTVAQRKLVTGDLAKDLADDLVEPTPFERTMFIGPGFVPPSPAAQAPPAPPPPAAGKPIFAGAAAEDSAPGSGPADAGSRRPAGPSPSLLGPSLDHGPARKRSPDPEPPQGAPWAAPAAAGPTSQPRSAPGVAAAGPASGAYAQRGADEAKGRQRIAAVAVIGAVVGLSVFAGVLVLRAGNSASAGAEQTATSATTAVTAAPPASATVAAPATQASTATAADTNLVAAPTASAVATNAPVAATSLPTTSPAPTGNAPSTHATGTGPAPTAVAVVKPTSAPTSAPTPQPTSAPTSAPASGDATGTLVAVAVGGTCAFSVNGASKGTTSSLKLQLKPGTYSVSCKPATGATKSKSVTVGSGATAMAMFRLE